jgi:hypothetical protein
MPYSALHHTLNRNDDLSAAPVKTLGVTWQLYVNRARTYAVSTQAVTRMLLEHISKTAASGKWLFAKDLQKKRRHSIALRCRECSERRVRMPHLVDTLTTLLCHDAHDVAGPPPIIEKNAPQHRS